MKFGNILDSAKSALFTEEPKPVEPVSHPQLGPSSVAMLTSTRPAYIPSTYVPEDTPLTNTAIGIGPNPFVDKLKAKTDFDSTPIGKSLKEHLAPLDGLPLSESQQLTAAIKSGVKDGLSNDSILNTYNDLVNALESEKTKFDSSMTDAVSKNVTVLENQIKAETDKIKDLEAQISASRDKQSQIATDLVEARTKVQQAQSQFSSAYEQRKAELQSTIQHYTAILRGQ